MPGSKKCIQGYGNAYSRIWQSAFGGNMESGDWLYVGAFHRFSSREDVFTHLIYLHFQCDLQRKCCNNYITVKHTKFHSCQL
jgi:hypothetical protein